MYARIKENKLEYASLEMHIEGIGVVNNPTPSMLAGAGYKDVIHIEVDTLEKVFEQTENNIIIYKQKVVLSAIDLLDSRKAADDFNRVFLYRLVDSRIDKGYIAKLLDNKTKDSLRILRYYLKKLNVEGIVTDSEIASCFSIMQAQNIDLESL